MNNLKNPLKIASGSIIQETIEQTGTNGIHLRNIEGGEYVSKEVAEELLNALKSALKNAKIEKQAWRYWHNRANKAIKKATE